MFRCSFTVQLVSDKSPKNNKKDEGESPLKSIDFYFTRVTKIAF